MCYYTWFDSDNGVTTFSAFQFVRCRVILRASEKRVNHENSNGKFGP